MGERSWIQVFELEDMTEVTVFSDSHWGWTQRHEEIVKRGGLARGATPFESMYRKTADHRQKQKCMQPHWERQKRMGSKA